MKRATTFDEQITLLENRGMLIADKNKALEVLADIGYYRLGFYSFPFESRYPCKHNRDHTFRDGASFEDVLALYYFDNDLRTILSLYLHRVEVHLRTTIIYTVSNLYKHNPTWFSDSRVMAQDFIVALPTIYNDIRKNNVIKYHHKKYPNDIYAPAWKTLEFMTFGGILFLFDNLKNPQIKSQIAETMGVKNIDVFNSHMQTLRVLRNICAHAHNLFDLRLAKSINPGPIRGMSAAQRSSISGAMAVLKFTLGNISINRELDYCCKVNSLIDSAEKTAIAPIIRNVLKL